MVVSNAVVDEHAYEVGNEADRLGTLLLNTSGLIGIALAVALPLGCVLAILQERTALPGANRLRGVIVASLFVPLPVLAVAWQIVLGSWLPSLALAPGAVAWRPWSQGLLPAGVVHGFAALPWVAVIILVGLRTTDRTLEEDAMVIGGPRLLIRLVLLPRLALAALAAAAWIAVQAATEIPVTDAMMVRTLAEEVYTQIVGAGGVHGAILITLPVLLSAIVLSTLLVRGLARRFPQNPDPTAAPLRLPLGNWRIAAAYGIVTIAFALPFGALLWKAAGGGTLKQPSLTFLGDEVVKVLRVHGRVLLLSLLTALVTGYVTARLALALAWSARTSRIRASCLLLAAVTLALTPGPIIGQGLKNTILIVLGWEESLLAWLGLSPTFPPVRSLLYDQPSPVPTVLACLLRFLPLALLILAPVIRAIPRDLEDLARRDGVSLWRYVGEPATRRAVQFASMAVAGLALGEVSASKLVAPPGWRMFILDLFDQMHYGAEPTVAAMALVQVLVVAVVLSVGLRGR